MRGEVWDTVFPRGIGRHPAVVLSINRMNIQIGNVAVLLITGTSGPPETHVRLDLAAGVAKYDESFVNITDLHAVPKSRLQRWRGRVHPSTELAHISERVLIYLGLEDAAAAMLP